MAKKVRRQAATPANQKADVVLTPQDKKTLQSLQTLADGVVETAERRKAPHLDIPSRSLSNVQYNKSKRFIEMGNGKNRRQLFNLSQAKSYMQTMLVGSGCKRLIEQGKTTSIRGLYYLLKHTIEGTKEETFDDQDECDPIIEDVEVTLNALREELHLYAKNARRDGRAASRWSTAATRSTARGWARAATAFRRSSSRRSIAVQEVRRQVHPACRKGHGLAAVQRRQVLAASTTAFSRTAAASRRAACGGCSTGCTTN